LLVSSPQQRALWGASLVERQVAWMRAQPKEVRGAVRILKQWRANMNSKLRKLSRCTSMLLKDAIPRSYLLEVVVASVNSGMCNTTDGELRIRTLIVETCQWLSRWQDLRIVWSFGDLLKSNVLGFSEELPLVLDPVNPTNNLARTVKSWKLLGEAAHSLVTLILPLCHCGWTGDGWKQELLQAWPFDYRDLLAFERYMSKLPDVPDVSCLSCSSRRTSGSKFTSGAHPGESPEHLCLLGAIAKVEHVQSPRDAEDFAELDRSNHKFRPCKSIFRPRIVLQNEKGEEVPVMFYNDVAVNGENALSLENLEEGDFMGIVSVGDPGFISNMPQSDREALNSIGMRPLQVPPAIEQRKCAHCRKRESLKRCEGCKTTFYCNRRCQKAHWSHEHKSQCKFFTLESSVVEHISQTEHGSVARGPIHCGPVVWLSIMDLSIVNVPGMRTMWLCRVREAHHVDASMNRRFRVGLGYELRRREAEKLESKNELVFAVCGLREWLPGLREWLPGLQCFKTATCRSTGVADGKPKSDMQEFDESADLPHGETAEVPIRDLECPNILHGPKYQFGAALSRSRDELWGIVLDQDGSGLKIANFRRGPFDRFNEMQREDTCERIRVGDLIIRINDVTFNSLSAADSAQRLLAQLSSSTRISLTIQRRPQQIYPSNDLDWFSDFF